MNSGPHRSDCYTDLGVRPAASRKEVETALWRWRERWRRGEAAEEDLRKAEKAYLVLTDSRRRQAHDRLLGLSRHPAWTKKEIRKPASARRVFLKCRTLMKRGDFGGALKLARRAAALDPGCALYWSVLGILVLRTGGSLREAVRHGQRGYELDPGERRIALNLAILYEKAGLHRRARRLRRDHRWKLSAVLPPRP